MRTRRLEVLTWDTLLVIFIHAGFTWKTMNLMLILQCTGIKSQTRQHRISCTVAHPTPANFTEKQKHAGNFQRPSSQFIAWSATGIPRGKQENWVKASELEFDEVRDESRRKKMIIIINSHDNR